MEKMVKVILEVPVSKVNDLIEYVEELKKDDPIVDEPIIEEEDVEELPEDPIEDNDEPQEEESDESEVEDDTPAEESPGEPEEETVETPSEDEEQEEPVVEGDHPVDDIEDLPEAPKVFNTKILYGVNFRTHPSTGSNSKIIRLLRKGENVRVIKQHGSYWLYIETSRGELGYISSNTKYTSYRLSSQWERSIDLLFAEGEKYLGAPYVFGAKPGQVNDKGQRVFDCSSFTQTIFKDALNVSLKRVSYNQATQGVEVPLEELRRGDLVFFRVSSRGLEIGHVAVYAGDDRLLHTYGSGGVRYTKFKGTQWETRFTTARRMF